MFAVEVLQMKYEVVVQTFLFQPTENVKNQNEPTSPPDSAEFIFFLTKYTLEWYIIFYMYKKAWYRLHFRTNSHEIHIVGADPPMGEPCCFWK